MAGIILNGSVIKGLILNGSPVTAMLNGVKVFPTEAPSGPLPAYTLRLKFTEGTTPSRSKGTLTQVSSSPNVWDWTYNNENWSDAWHYYSKLLEVLDAGDTSGVTNMYELFAGCSNLTSVPLFDTSNVTNMKYMFDSCSKLASVPLFDTSKVSNMYGMLVNCSKLASVPLFDTSNVTDMSYMLTNCKALTSVPLFNTSKVTNMSYMFQNCYKVKSGALALYQQASTQSNPPSNHAYTFKDCGRDTTAGAAELAQIPDDWK